MPSRRARGGNAGPAHLAAGNAAEIVAERWLAGRGLTLVTRNFRSRFGEIDLVMRDADCLVFVEVRYRKRGSQVTARQSIGPHKISKLTATANWFLARHPQFSGAPVRFDVVAIDGPPEHESALQWLPDAFRPGA